MLVHLETLQVKFKGSVIAQSPPSQEKALLKWPDAINADFSF